MYTKEFLLLHTLICFKNILEKLASQKVFISIVKSNNVKGHYSK